MLIKNKLVAMFSCLSARKIIHFLCEILGKSKSSGAGGKTQTDAIKTRDAGKI